MKNTTYLMGFLCLILSLYITNCSNPDNSSGAVSTEKVKEIGDAASDLLQQSNPTPVKDSISVDTFNTWVANWDLYGNSWMDTAKITAFNMPLADLSQVLGEFGVDSSRFYIGLKEHGGGYTAKMMVVGVNNKGQDMLNPIKGQYVYDLSRPCPPICGK